MSTIEASLEPAVAAAKARLDEHTVKIVQRHFHESTGCPFWLEQNKSLKFDPLTEVNCYDDLKKFPEFQDEWLRGGSRLTSSKLVARQVSRNLAWLSMTFAMTTKSFPIRCRISIFPKVETG